ncbi:MAG: hypothetical protein ACRDO1_04860 [Nocardioidaceae bacterium]
MVYQERNTWTSLVVSVIAMTAYTIVVLQRAGDGPLTEVEWWPIMLWTIGASIVATIVLSIGWGAVAGIGDRDGIGRSDERDRDIARLGERVGSMFAVIAGLGVIVLCAVEAHWFWIANTMFFGFALWTVAGGIIRVVAYRRGLM